MCKSITVLFSIPTMSDDDYVAAGYPLFSGQFDDPNTHARSFLPQWVTAISPLTNTPFKIMMIPGVGAGQSIKASGYMVEINPPICTVGNDYFVKNHVWLSCVIARLQLQYWLAKNGASTTGLSAITLNHCAIFSATLSVPLGFCAENMPLDTKKYSYQRASFLYNRKTIDNHWKVNPVFKILEGRYSTVVFNHPDYQIRAYVKDTATHVNKSSMPEKAVNAEILKEARLYLYHDVTVSEAWLRDHGLQSPKSWKRVGRYNPDGVAFDIVNHYLAVIQNSSYKPVDVIEDECFEMLLECEAHYGIPKNKLCNLIYSSKTATKGIAELKRLLRDRMGLNGPRTAASTGAIHIVSDDCMSTGSMPFPVELDLSKHAWCGRGRRGWHEGTVTRAGA